jgi:phospho-N-acetylmuramoyl-pentapeptide-transferase
MLFVGLPFYVTLLSSAVCAYPVYKWLLAMKVRQTVSSHLPTHQGKQGTPTMGGIIFVLGITAGLVTAAAKGEGSWWTVGLFAGFSLIGFVDDFVVPRMFPGKRGLGWMQKLGGQLLLGALPAIAAKQMDPLSLGASIFLVLLFANAYNFADGLDGLASLIGIFLFFGLGALALTQTANSASPDLHVASCVIAGLAIFLFLNAPPAKIFMGDVGSMGIGALGGLITFQALFAGTTPLGQRPWLPVAVLSVVMLIELVPGPIQILSVKLRKKRIFPKTPIHHAFEDAGWPETRIVFTFAMVQLLCTLIAINLMLKV